MLTPPPPRVLYVHDDLTEGVLRAYGDGSAAFSLTQELLGLVRRDAARAIVLTLEEQVEKLIASGDHSPFATTLGIGRAGQRAAEHLNNRTG